MNVCFKYVKYITSIFLLALNTLSCPFCDSNFGELAWMLDQCSIVSKG
jgi:hypothetical protein